MATQIFLTTTGTNTWTVPSDWNNSNNTIQVISGGGGGDTNGGGGGGGAGGGGGYSKISNINLTPGTSISYTVGVGGAPATNGGDSYFNGASVIASPVGATGGQRGNAASGGTGGTGGGTAAPTTATGGNGGTVSGGGSNGGGGGGGAAGPHGNGVSGASVSGGSTTGGTGGNGDNGSGGTGGTTGNAGGNGTEFDGTHGCGGGGGGGSQGGPGSATGGNYGGGGGGGQISQAGNNGIQGIIVINYTSVFTTPRYWVGGTGNWDASTTTHWSTTSGGSGGASVPTSANDVVFDFNSGSGTVTVTATATCNTFNTVSYTGTINLGSQTINLAGSGAVWNVTTGFSLIPGTSTIKITDTTSNSKIFSGNGLTYNNIWITGSGTGQYTIQGSNTFNDFKVDTPPHTVNFTESTTQNLNTFTVSGTAGNLMTLQSTVSGLPWFLHKISTGTISCDYLSLQDSHVS